jgi:ferric-dicitrate binding protein FerR (iron transport regulator)
MNSPRYAQVAAQLLVRDEPTVPPTSGADRIRAIAVIEASLKKKAQRRQGWRIAVGFMAAAAAIAVGSHSLGSHFNLLSPGSSVAVGPLNGKTTVSAIGTAVASGARVLSATSSQPFLDGNALPTGEGLVTDETGSASLHLSTGTNLALEKNGKLSFAEAGSTQRFVLGRGAVSAKVTKLHKGERFIVTTPDAEVEVRGTAFRVALAEPGVQCGNGTRTRVYVSEGVVEVRANSHTVFVKPGETWPADCQLAAVAAAEDVPTATAEADEPAPTKSKHRRTRRHARHSAAVVPDAAEVAAASSLAEQNGLFHEGVAARRQGDSEAASEAFEKLVTNYPASPLAENAVVARMRGLVAVDRTRAVVAARSYLADYPHGYARSEAEAIVAAGP